MLARTQEDTLAGLLGGGEEDHAGFDECEVGPVPVCLLSNHKTCCFLSSVSRSGSVTHISKDLVVLNCESTSHAICERSGLFLDDNLRQPNERDFLLLNAHIQAATHVLYQYLAIT